jgi:hypothetical protein
MALLAWTLSDRGFDAIPQGGESLKDALSPRAGSWHRLYRLTANRLSFVTIVEWEVHALSVKKLSMQRLRKPQARDLAP